MVFWGFNLVVIALIVAAMIGLRFLRPGMLVWAIAWWFAWYAFIDLGFATPVPASVKKLYMAIVTLALFAYVTSDRGRLDSFMGPIVRLVTVPRYRPLLVAVLLVIPLLAAWNVYAEINVAIEAPAFGRTVHPAPPDKITVHEEEIDLVTADNPYRALEETDPDAFAAHVENGRRLYFENCFFCHGDSMGGDGMFAHALNPIPSNFNDPGVLPMLQESFVFWRVSKGAPGLPEEGGPWDSAMPAWENFLTTEEMWDVVLFLYDFNDYRPRAREEGHH
ncbi:MAG TPA: c-type cytochrome [Candidatus Polarisedimenticolaceae bacterium]|nr:c-type cytochrome [Candidatus Polarisedimenticolaceae bacterium]